jgi:hypothetical protein
MIDAVNELDLSFLLQNVHESEATPRVRLKYQDHDFRARRVVAIHNSSLNSNNLPRKRDRTPQLS